jgi:hypothetical protein
MKFSYLCIVGRKIGDGALASRNFVSGLQDFTACPARKTPSGNRQRELINHKLLIYDFLLQFKRSAHKGPQNLTKSKRKSN